MGSRFGVGWEAISEMVRGRTGLRLSRGSSSRRADEQGSKWRDGVVASGANVSGGDNTPVAVEAEILVGEDKDEYLVKIGAGVVKRREVIYSIRTEGYLRYAKSDGEVGDGSDLDSQRLSC